MSAERSLFDSIKALCLNEEGNPESDPPSQLVELQDLLNSNPNVAQEKDESGCTLLHYAAEIQPPEFCRRLIDVETNLVRVSSNFNRLPFHHACRFSNIETAKYLYHLYPESINIPCAAIMNVIPDLHPLNLTCSPLRRETEDQIKMVEFLLAHDQGAVSTPTSMGYLPLHLACVRDLFVIAALIFDAYPQAIHVSNDSGEKPLDLARRFGGSDMVQFFEHQIDLELQAGEDRTPDTYGMLPIHRALGDDRASLGAVKLMLAAHPDSIRMDDNLGRIPLHIACWLHNPDVIKFLIGIDTESLEFLDINERLPLHIACFGGRCNVITCILDQSKYGLTMRDISKQTPIDLLLLRGRCDRDSMEYVEAVRRLLQAAPIDSINRLLKTGKSDKIEVKQDAGIKRKREEVFDQKPRRDVQWGIQDFCVIS